MTSNFGHTSDLPPQEREPRPPLVLIHGLGVDHRMWGLQIPALHKLGQVWAPDLPGFDGASRPPGHPETPKELADWLAAQMRLRGFPAAKVAGYSMGGTVALLLALRHPSLVSRLALCCSSPCWGLGIRKPIGLGFARVGGRCAMEIFQKSVLWGFSRYCDDPALQAQVTDMVAKADRRSMLHIYRRLTRIDLRSRLAEIAVPTLVVGGTRDWLAAPAHQRILAGGIPDARLVMMPGADHILCLGRAQEFTSTLVTFFAPSEGGEANNR